MADRYQYRPEAVGSRDNHNTARGADSDPLAELARLIGQTDPSANFTRANHRTAAVQPQPQDHYQDHHQDQYQDKPLEPASAEPAPPSWMRAAVTADRQQPVSPPMHPVAHEQDYYPADDQAQQYQAQQYDDTPAFLRTARQHDPSRYDDVLYDQNSQNAEQQQHQQYADGQYQDGYQDQSDPNAYPPFYADGQDEPQRKRGGLTTVIAVLLLAVVGTAAAYGYRSFTGSPRSGEPPVIKAEAGASKIVPPTQTSDASGKIVDRIGGSANGQERVLSREEQPIDINGRNAPRVVFPPLNQNGNPPALAATTQTTPAAGQQQAANGALGDEPKRVRTLAIRTDQPDSVPQQSAQAQRPTSARAQAPAPSGNAPMQLSPAPGAPGSIPVRTASAPPAAAPAGGGSGGYMVQISSQRSEADAQASYRAMQSKFPNVLGARSASIRRADLGEKGIYYRAMVGPFAAAEEAGQLCSSLRSAGGQCVVQRN
jgi:hypothetical protein